MKPRTRIQKEVVRLSSGLPELTDKQKAYAFEHCFKHHAYRTKGGTITCSECGHRWKGGHTLAETICGCSCPHCGKELEILDTRKRVFRGSAYYEIITTRKGYQVLRYFMVGATYKVGQKAEYSIREVVQWWIAPNGKTEVIARLRAMHTMYYDLWTEWSDMDLRSNKMLKAYNIDAYKTYPAMRIIPELKRNGFKGAFHELPPYEFFTAILTDSNKETLLKAGQTEMFRYAVISNINLHEYWNSIKICIRNGYYIADASMWCDLVRLLRHFGKDTHCPKYVCPTDLKKAHHFTPRNYFDEKPETKQMLLEKGSSSVLPKLGEIKTTPTSFINEEIVKWSLKCYKTNKLYQFLASQFGESSAMSLMKKYRVGSSRYWDGATVFWQIDHNNQVRTGKIMLYNPETGKRIKEPHNHITWAHSLLHKSGFNLKQCFFGEHLLSTDKTRPVALVESEKTALIASYYLPQYLWLASGGKNGCFNESSLSALTKRCTVLFPDLGATSYWQSKIGMMRNHGIEVQLFDYLETNTPESERNEGYDIADYLLQIQPDEAILQAMSRKNPHLKTLIETLGLELVNVQRDSS